MTNFDLIKTMNRNQLANFVNISRPNCNDICKDAKSGCAFGCQYRCGEDVIRGWLDLDVNDDRKI